MFFSLLKRDLLHEYQEQLDSLEITFTCKDGVVKCSRQYLSWSQYLYGKGTVLMYYFQCFNKPLQINKLKSTAGDMINFLQLVDFKSPLDFDYSMYSKAAIHLVLDALHLINVKEVDLLVLAEALDYLHFEGKTLLSHFEKRLAKSLMETLAKMKLPTSTQLLLCMLISTMDNYDDFFEKTIGSSLTQGMDFRK